MPRTKGQDARRIAYSGLGDGLTKALDLVTATIVWGGAGFLVDRWLHTWPICFAIGAVIGNFTGLYVLYRRSIAESGEAGKDTAAGVSRTWPPRPAPARGYAAGKNERADGTDDR